MLSPDTIPLFYSAGNILYMYTYVYIYIYSYLGIYTSNVYIMRNNDASKYHYHIPIIN